MGLFQRVKEAAAGRWAGILGLDLESMARKGIPCPVCGTGTDRFYAFDDSCSTGRVHCRKCMEKATSDGIATYAWLRGMTMIDACKNIAAMVGVETDGRKRPVIDILAEVSRIKRMPLDSFKEYGPFPATRNRQPVARVPLYDRHFQKISHFDLGLAGDLVKGLCAYNRPAGMFLPGRTKPTGLVIVTEGVKDAAALHSLGYFAIGMPTSSISPQFCEFFRGLDVVYMPDLDEAGWKGSRRSARRLYKIAKTIAIARLPGEIKRKDGDGVREVLASLGADAIHEAISNAEHWTPDADDPSAELDLAKILEMVPFKQQANLEDALDWVAKWRVECIIGEPLVYRLYSSEFDIAGEYLEVEGRELLSFNKFNDMMAERCKSYVSKLFSDVWDVAARSLIDRSIPVDGGAERSMIKLVAGKLYHYLTTTRPIELDIYIGSESSTDANYRGILCIDENGEREYLIEFTRMTQEMKRDIVDFTARHLTHCFERCGIKSRRIQRRERGFNHEYRSLKNDDLASLAAFAGYGEPQEITEALEKMRDNDSLRSDGHVVKINHNDYSASPKSPDSFDVSEYGING